VTANPALTMDPKAILAECDRAEVAEGGLAAFVRLAWHLVESTPLVWEPHLDLVCAHYEAVSRGECRELVVNVPPGCSKSTITNVFWVAWDWIRNGWRKWIFTSYSHSLTLRDALKCANLVNSEWYQARFGLSADRAALAGYGWKPVAIGPKDAEHPAKSVKSSLHWTTQGGLRLSTMFGGAVTGYHGHILVADDPIKPQDIQNGGDQARGALEKVTTRWTQTFSSRSADPKTFARVIIMQRLHENDLAGFAVGAGATHLRLPMEYEAKDHCSTPWGEDWRREDGELLAPGRFPRSVVESRKVGVSARDYAAQYQQRPSPESGAIFMRGWFQRRWSALPAGIRLIMSVDATFKESSDADFVVAQVWGVHGGEFYLVDQVRGRMDISGTMQAIRDLRRKWPRIGQILIEDKANGPAIISLLRREMHGILPVEPEGGKEARANAAEPCWRAGNVLLPDEPWVGEFIEEHVKFPVGSHDDQVDAGTQALIFMTGKGSRKSLTQAMKNVREGKFG
jgi:predicted phage terminase large subunit-like protein